MKQYFFLLLSLAAFAFAGCHKDEPKEVEGHYDRTVLVYMAMQNSLGSSGYHRADSAEIANAMGFIPANDRLLLFIDDARAPRIYELNRGLDAKNPKTGLSYGPKLVKKWNEDLSSASAATLTEVLEYMRRHYDSDSYGLVMGSHATGWLPTDMSTSSNNSPRREEADDAPAAASNRRKTFGIDVGPDGSMSRDKGVAGSVPDQIEIADIAKAVKASGVHLDYILFDACLMQDIEVNYALRDVADYIIASPISISAEGAYYTDLVHFGIFSGDPVDVARTYAEYYKGEGTIPYRDGYGTVISCVRTAAVDEFTAKMRSLLHDVARESDVAVYVDGGNLDLMATLKRANMRGALNYHPYASNNYYRPHYYDIISLFKVLGADELQMMALRDALHDLVAYKGATPTFWSGPGYYATQTMPADEEDWCGVSMFVPQQIYTDNARNCPYGDLNEAFKTTEWYKVVFAL